MIRKNNQQITVKNPRAAGAPKLNEQPLQRLTTYGSKEEVARVRALLKPRRVIEVCLDECDRLTQPNPLRQCGDMPDGCCAKCHSKRKAGEVAPIDEETKE